MFGNTMVMVYMYTAYSLHSTQKTLQVHVYITCAYMCMHSGHYKYTVWVNVHQHYVDPYLCSHHFWACSVQFSPVVQSTLFTDSPLEPQSPHLSGDCVCSHLFLALSTHHRNPTPATSYLHTYTTCKLQPYHWKPSTTCYTNMYTAWTAVEATTHSLYM